MESSEDSFRWGLIEQGSETNEQRAHRRMRCKGTAEVHLFPAGIKCEGSVADLSLGGCCIESEEPILEPIGTRVEVYLRVMGTTVQVAGVLCHIHHQVWAGIQFTGVSARKMVQIQELIDELFEGIVAE